MEGSVSKEDREWNVSMNLFKLERQRDRLRLALSELTKDYESLAVRMRQERAGVIVSWATLLALVAVSQYVIEIFLTRGYGTLSIVPAVILQGMCIFAYASLLVYCAHQTFSFLFRCSAKESDYVERERIQTYPKEKLRRKSRIC